MLHSFLHKIRQESEFSSDITAWRTFPRSSARFVSGKEVLNEVETAWLERLGANRLYSHQARALDLIHKGRDVVLATPTSSGKSLVYTLPLLHRAAEKGERGLLLFPLKALARDQYQGLLKAVRGTVLERPGMLAVYDGDTSQGERSRIRTEPPRVLITNPDMLHFGLLPYHHLWADFFRELSLVVVDEVHTYRGVMGSNMAWVFRRLHRVCADYGSDPQHVFCSATISNPVDLSTGLTGREPAGVTESGADRGKRHYVLLNPLKGPTPVVLSLLEEAVSRGLRTIVYTQSRRMTELIAVWAGERDKEFKRQIRAYRAGFLPGDRREIERQLAEGELLAVVSTSALELGLDIGDLDVCILVGYPGSIMATVQRAGRVGRQGRESAVFLVAHEDALDQYLMRHPQALFSSSPEAAVINPDNPEISGRHLVCAAAELPVQRNEAILDFPGSTELLTALVNNGSLVEGVLEEIFYSPGKYPHRDVDLRGSGKVYTLYDRVAGEVIGTVDGIRAFYETHPGAVYLHMGRTYLVDDLDTEKRMVSLRPFKANYFTRVRTEKSTRIIEVQETRRLGSTLAGWGRLRVTEKVVGYEKRLVRGQTLIGRVDLDLPEQVFVTQGLWIAIPEEIRTKTEGRQMHFMGGIHALEHLLIGVAPFFVLTDRNDLGGISIPCHDQLEAAGVFVYDGFAGGVGLTRQAYARLEEMAARGLDIVRDCECENGCPACVYSPKCGSGNRPLDKRAAGLVLQGLVSGTNRPDSKSVVTVVPSPEEETPDPQQKRGPERFAVLDLETRRSAAEVGGWHRAGKMGVSCAVVYDSQHDDFFTFFQDEMPAMSALLQDADLVVGFNLLRFDYRVLAGVYDFPWEDLPTLDILAEVHGFLGFRLSLDHLASQTLGAAKSADGLAALKWWKEGLVDRIVDYCRQDVAVTRDLYLFGLRNG
ncbi:MAG: DEAD/DEAH box helicase, partial [Desulfonatronovibrionaceae bacterium]